MANYTFNDIDIRSPKIRKLLGEKPPVLVRNGIAIGIIFILIVCIIILSLPFPNGEGERVYEHLRMELFHDKG